MTDESDNPYRSPESPADLEPPRAAPAAVGRRYNAYTRGRAYASFILGLHAASFMLGGVHPVLAAFALGLGIPAYVLAQKETPPNGGAFSISKALPGWHIQASDVPILREQGAIQ